MVNPVCETQTAWLTKTHTPSTQAVTWVLGVEVNEAAPQTTQAVIWVFPPPRPPTPKTKWFECWGPDLGSGVTLKSRVKWPWFRNSWVVVHNRKIAISRDLANQNASRDCVFRDTVGKIRAWTFKICIARDRRSKHGIGKMAGSLQFFDFSDFRQKIKLP